MKNKKGSVIIGIGLLMMFSAILLAGYNIYSDKTAARLSVNATAELNKILDDVTNSDIFSDDEFIPDYILNPDMPMPAQHIDGWEYVGIVDIPDLGLNLPVIDNYSRQAIKVAPACYSGSAYKDDFIICAHNYKAHFGKISNLSEGNVITFTDIDGNIFNYEVTEKEILDPTEVERLISGDWDLTLISCTASGQARVTVRCNRI